MAALTSKAIELAVGTNSCSNSSCFGPSSIFVMVQPVDSRPAGRDWRQTSLNWVPPQSRRLMPSLASSRADLIVLNQGEACQPLPVLRISSLVVIVTKLESLHALIE
jgi:hypothetical protein